MVPYRVATYMKAGIDWQIRDATPWMCKWTSCKCRRVPEAQLHTMVLQVHTSYYTLVPRVQQTMQQFS